MGNRAMVVFEGSYEEGKPERGPAVYLHWNGGPESVHAFLKELDLKKMRVNDVMYETARFIQIAGDFFDSGKSVSTLSLGVQTFDGEDYAKIDPGDNGVYLVNRAKKTVRRFGGGVEFSKADVKKEKAAALKHDTYKGILKTLAELRKGKKIEG